ncbi:hypothetical protein NM208_g5927 [Fusarium decemcellulare]|uniref:Uncharacterized protein n=1 Tax=Fusarium decemcellulare TaxID=57161 RepID=A0ACC1SF19_9HYPO|nr:hypothetical protein NM208_g5927 [Fusarium decemcellulare]
MSTMQGNHGVSIPDVVAVGDNKECLGDWKKRSGIDTSKQIRLVKLAHMRYQHPDLDSITTFLEDFGMHIVKRTDSQVFYRGTGTDQYVYFAQRGPMKFLGGTFEVESYQDLERASKLPNAGTIQELRDAPGGGHLITLTDPLGFPINLLYGQHPRESDGSTDKLVYNYESEKLRIRKFQRFTTGPAAVHKLGHFGLCVADLDTMARFYTTTFNLVPTDFMYVEENGKKRIVGLFSHIDRGRDCVDHHCFFITKNATSHVHHASFEIHDFDSQHLGHDWLVKKNYKPAWGIGRHILGSQVFDYWWDPTGFMIEHYADGDLVNDETPIGYGLAGNESLAVWGPDVPEGFLE